MDFNIQEYRHEQGRTKCESGKQSPDGVVKMARSKHQPASGVVASALPLAAPQQQRIFELTMYRGGLTVATPRHYPHLAAVREQTNRGEAPHEVHPEMRVLEGSEAMRVAGLAVAAEDHRARERRGRARRAMRTQVSGCRCFGAWRLLRKDLGCRRRS